MNTPWELLTEMAMPFGWVGCQPLSWLSDYGCLQSVMRQHQRQGGTANFYSSLLYRDEFFLREGKKDTLGELRMLLMKRRPTIQPEKVLLNKIYKMEEKK